MKQHITIKQWNELNKKEKLELLGGGYHIIDWVSPPTVIGVGEMIEFLGKDLKEMIFHGDRFIDVILRGNKEFQEEPVNALWEAVKYKLNLI